MIDTDFERATETEAEQLAQLERAAQNATAAV